jgi:protein-S-isoprenylcysteine O-methyltransferase Ste14
MILLGRMENELLRDGALTRSTARAMWTTYAVYGALLTAALARRPVIRATPTTNTAGGLLVAGGIGLDVASVRRFSGPRQLTGTAVGDLVTGGVYRYSRNPQYTGMVAALLGLSLLRRSGLAVALAAGMGAALRHWVPVEEAHLSRQFGEPYERYKAVTARWLGIPRSSRTDA